MTQIEPNFINKGIAYKEPSTDLTGDKDLKKAPIWNLYFQISSCKLMDMILRHNTLGKKEVVMNWWTF